MNWLFLSWQKRYSDVKLFIILVSDRAFLVFRPSLVTASCIAAARICLRIAPTWTPDLQQTTNFLWHQLIPCIEILLKYGWFFRIEIIVLLGNVLRSALYHVTMRCGGSFMTYYFIQPLFWVRFKIAGLYLKILYKVTLEDFPIRLY